MPAVSIAFILIAIAARIILQINFLSTDGDKSYQIQAAQNFIRGHGFSLLEVYANDLSKAQYVPLIKWPPGYSLFLSPFIVVCKNNAVLATLLLDLLTCIAFVLLSRKLLMKLAIPVWLVNIYTLITGFFLYSFSIVSTSDFLTLTICIAALFISLKIIESGKLHIFQLILLSQFLFLTAFTRYLYLPVAFIIPLCIVAIAFFNRNKLLVKKGVIVFLLTTLLITLFLIWQTSISGTATYVRATEKGFYPDQLGQLYPFIFSSFFNLEFFHSRLTTFAGLSFEKTAIMVVVLHHLIFFAFLFIFIRWIIQKKFLQSGLQYQHVFIGGITSLAIVASLGWLSLTNAPYAGGGGRNWNYLQESRYFAFPFFFCQQLAVVIFYHSRQAIRKWTKTLILFVFLLSGIDFLHNVYFAAKTIVSEQEKIINNLTTEGLIDHVNKKIKELQQENQVKAVVVISEPAFIGSQAGIYKPVPALYQYTPMQNTAMKTSNEVVVLFITDNEQKMPVTFTTNPTKKIIGSYKNYSFYSIHVKPAEP